MNWYPFGSFHSYRTVLQGGGVLGHADQRNGELVYRWAFVGGRCLCHAYMGAYRVD